MHWTPSAFTHTGKYHKLILTGLNVTLKQLWNFTNYKWRKFQRKMSLCWITSWVSKLSPNLSQGPKALSFETWSSVAVCLAGLPRVAWRQPAMPEVSGSLPQSLEVKSPACPIGARRAPRHCVQNKEGAWRTWVWLQKPWLLGIPMPHPTKQIFLSALRLPLWTPNEFHTNFTVDCKSA